MAVYDSAGVREWSIERRLDRGSEARWKKAEMENKRKGEGIQAASMDFPRESTVLPRDSLNKQTSVFLEACGIEEVWVQLTTSAELPGDDKHNGTFRT